MSSQKQLLSLHKFSHCKCQEHTVHAAFNKILVALSHKSNINTLKQSAKQLSEQEVEENVLLLNRI